MLTQPGLLYIQEKCLLTLYMAFLVIMETMQIAVLTTIFSQKLL